MKPCEDAIERVRRELRAAREAWDRKQRGEPEPQPPPAPRKQLSGAEALAAYRRLVQERQQRAEQMEAASARLGVSGYVRDATDLLAQRLNARERGR